MIQKQTCYFLCTTPRRCATVLLKVEMHVIWARHFVKMFRETLKTQMGCNSVGLTGNGFSNAVANFVSHMSHCWLASRGGLIRWRRRWWPAVACCPGGLGGECACAGIWTCV